MRLALAETTVPQIATITGHSLKDVEAILDVHYLGRAMQLAEMAIATLEKRTNLQSCGAFRLRFSEAIPGSV